MSQENETAKSGWIKLHRELIDKPIWANSTLEQRVILITLLCMANHAPKKWEWNGKPYEVQPGQFITSLASIVEKCKCKDVTIKKVRTALLRFEKLGFLASEATNKNRLVTIVNWGKYQDYPNTEGKQEGNQRASNGQAEGKQWATNKNDKNIKNDKNDKEDKPYCTDYSDDFNVFWEVYPKKVSKAAAFKAFKKINPDEKLLNTMVKAINTSKHSNQWKKDGGQFIPYPATWLNGGRWEDETEEVTEIGNDERTYRNSNSGAFRGEIRNGTPPGFKSE